MYCMSIGVADSLEENSLIIFSILSFCLGFSTKNRFLKPLSVCSCGHSVFEFVHEYEINLFFKMQSDIYEGNNPGLFKHRILMKDGSYNWFETSCQVVREEYPQKIKIVAV